jgi:3-methylfumaryl-CoA hydratase
MAEQFNDWIGRSTVRDDIVTDRLLAEYRATLGAWLFEPSDDSAPPGFHWGLAPATPAHDLTGPDGAEAKGVFLPPIPLPRRMWAGGMIETLKPIRRGARITRTSTVGSIVEKQGSTGALWLVSVTHEISGAGDLLLRERQDLVFRDLGPPAAPISPRPGALDHALHVIDASALLLFRFSAFTFNGHRIHYDLDHARREGYAGLLVHGPMQAALMLNAAARQCGYVPARFDYRCLAPLLGGHEFGVSCEEEHGEITARIIRCDGVTTAEGRVRVRGTT